MTHSDDTGLVLPPRLAPIQIIIVPIWRTEEDERKVRPEIKNIVEMLQKKGLEKIQVDWSEKHPGEKYYYWERKGVPIRIEVGPRDIRNKEMVLARRDTGKKETCNLNSLYERLIFLLNDIQQTLFQKALAYQKEKTKYVETWSDFKKQIRNGNFVLAHWHKDSAIEKKIKKETQATIRCIPFSQKEESGMCVYSGEPSKKRILFARAY